VIGNRLDRTHEDEVGDSGAGRGLRQPLRRHDVHPPQLPAHVLAVDRQMGQPRQVDYRVGAFECRPPVGVASDARVRARIRRAGIRSARHPSNPIAGVTQPAHQMSADEAAGTGHYHQPGGSAAGACSIVNAGTIHALIV